ncbi:multidrug effflux MFS transporter [Herbiconiux sp. CPCC 205716]|uniref:Multidrug effflux MFS transporter n=1 Tax=Herbiconiux gentiana TaxID=2970912 RepID=A0ABT2GH38_9MICO|nr:multidrug effflux MFS transporter [Herbiconiux gentiana]MCS5715527.1 multidrug effflux MFS transporter [Herbiconiux gentiana]
MTDTTAVRRGPRMPSRRVLVAILLGVIPLSQAPIDIYTPAIPTMITELGTTSTLVQNTVTVYVLGMSLGLIPVGVIADAKGRRPTLLVCLALLLVTSVGIAFTTDIAVLLVLRFLQGVGGCACMVLVYAVAADTTRGAKLTSLSGLLGASWGLAPVIAPAIGGFLVDAVSWRGIFVLVAVLAGIALLVVWLVLPETLDPADAQPIVPKTIARVLGGTLRQKIFLGLTLAFAVFASAQLLFGIVAPLLYEKVLGLTPFQYGAIALVIGAANLGGELATGAFATRISPRTLGFTALGSFVVGTAVLLVSGLTVGPDLLLLTIGAVFVMLGCGALCPLAYGLALGLFDRNLGLIGGLASAVCYLVVAATMGLASGLHDRNQVPLSLIYVGCAVVGAVLLALCLRPRPRAVPAAEADRVTQG